MKRKIDFSQLWIEEEQSICEWGSSLNDDAIVVEIGTAQGGSAYLFATSVIAKNVSIYSYDISPSQEALDNLKGLNVNIIKNSSVQGASEWSKGVSSSIDLLFIDGSHTLENVYSDFVSWFSYIKIGGVVIFHDYDPLSSGGSSHLGVKVFIEALTKQEAVEQIDHVGRLFCTKKRKNDVNIDKLIEDCFTVWKDLKRNVSTFIQSDYQNWSYMGREKNYLSILKQLRGLEGTGIESLDQVSDTTNILIILNSLPSDKIKDLYQKKNVYLLDDLTFYYMLEDSISNKRDNVLEITKNRNMFYKWEELLEMHNHSWIPTEKNNHTLNLHKSNICDISRECAFELVKINILKNIYFSIIGSI